MNMKEELLQKGMSEADADEILSKLESETEDDSLQALQKAIDGDDESLSKADDDGGDEDKDEDDDDDDKKTKKFMKTKGKAYCQKMMKELGYSGEKMQKAIDDVDVDSEGAVVEMTDLAPFLESQKEFNEAMVKAVTEMGSKVDLISSQGDKHFDLMQKAARVQIEQASALDGFLNTPQGRKGKVAIDKPMEKAAAVVNKSDNELVYSTLMKAVKNGVEGAGHVMGVFESGGKDINILSLDHKKFVSELLKEGK